MSKMRQYIKWCYLMQLFFSGIVKPGWKERMAAMRIMAIGGKEGSVFTRTDLSNHQGEFQVYR